MSTMETIRKEILVNLMGEQAPSRLWMTVKDMDKNDFGYLVRGLSAVGAKLNVQPESSLVKTAKSKIDDFNKRADEAIKPLLHVQGDK